MGWVRPSGRMSGRSLTAWGFDGTGVRKAFCDRAYACAHAFAGLPSKVIAGVLLLALASGIASIVCIYRLADLVADAQPPAAAPATEVHRASLAAAYVELSTNLKRAAYARLAAALNDRVTRLTESHAYSLLFDARYFGVPAGMFAKAATLVATDELTASTSDKPDVEPATEILAGAAPKGDDVRPAKSTSPSIRPRQIASASGADSARASSAASDQSAGVPTIFEKLFGRRSPITLAYAAPNDAGLSAGPSLSLGRYDRSTAVYDISAHTVYMPDGTRLEAHSGFGSLLDDPRHVDKKNRGATPPNVYDLEPREELFHGVPALRLIPVDNAKVFGRTGLLAHTYMLGPNGDSNGCVSFRNYNAFLQAYRNHTVKRLAVVSRLD